MAISVQWRRNLGSNHTGSVEVNNGTGKPVLYAHPLDNLGPNYSPCALWQYSQRDGQEDVVAASSLTLTVAGSVSYSTYAALFARWAKAGWFARAAARVVAGLLFQYSPGDAFGAPIATTLQASGSLRYEAFLTQSPPLEDDQTLEVRVQLAVAAVMPPGPGATGGGGILVNAKALNDDQVIGEIDSVAKLDGIAVGASQSFTFTVTIPSGGEVRVAAVDVGPAFRTSAGTVVFSGLASAEIVALD